MQKNFILPFYSHNTFYRDEMGRQEIKYLSIFWVDKFYQKFSVQLISKEYEKLEQIQYHFLKIYDLNRILFLNKRSVI